MDEYTPTTDEIVGAYMMERGRLAISFSEADEEFDRWLADLIREAKAEAWDELYSTQFDGMPGVNPNTLRDPANPYRVADQNGEHA